MRAPAAALAARLVDPLSHTWRLRAHDDPDRAPRLPARSAIYAIWHESILPAVSLFRDRGFVTLASLSRDGELAAHALGDLGLVARGSSSRGGVAGLRRLLEAAAAGRSIVLTPDGPRGPRRSVGPGIVRLAAATGYPIVPVGFAATAAVRLGSWDRGLLPCPGATVYVSVGEKFEPGAAEGRESSCGERRLAAAIERERRRAETATEEARRGRALRVRTLGGTPDAGPGPGPGGPGRIERRLRRSWASGRPGRGLRAAAAAHGLLRGARDGLYAAGVLPAHPAPLPIVSIGGITVGGSGKTPLAAELAGFLHEDGHRPAILTRGYADEMRLLADRCPRARVWGHPDRAAIARRAAADGATVAVLDDGLQHRRLRRDLDILALDRDALRRAAEAELPAGPFREPLEAALRRVDLVIVTGREPPGPEVEAFEADVHDRLAKLRPDIAPASVWLEDGLPEPANPAARAAPRPAAPTVALTGIMKPNLFFERARAHCPSLQVERAFPDHGRPRSEEWLALLERAGSSGLLLTAKDAMRLLPRIPEDIPVWVLPERIVWRRGLEEIRDRLRRAVPA